MSEIIEFKVMSSYLRICLFVFGALVFSANIIHFKFTFFCIFMIILGFFCVLASLIEDRWTFNFKTEKLTRSMGFVFFPIRQIINFTEIETIRIDEYTKNILKSEFCEISVVTKDGEIKRIDYDRSSFIKANIKKAKILQYFFSKRNNL